jgi:predicted TIM-barrel fold metal-dependent hydrolase
MSEVDLAGVPLVDQHCHGLVPLPEGDLIAWRACFTESRDEGTRRDHVTTSLCYRRLLGSLASFLGCEPDEEAVLEARSRLGRGLVGRLVADAGIQTLVLDRGFPIGEVLTDDLWRAGGADTASLLRLEPLMERLVPAHASWPELRAAMAAALRDVRGQGYVGLKSIAAYRTGLEIRPWDEEEVARTLAATRRRPDGPYRIEEKPLLDALLLVALGEASRQGLPVQFHVGYGDVDADLRLGNPLHLRWVLQEPRYRGAPIVLLHHCYPYTREGAYLAAVHERVHLDLSFGIPFLGLAELEACARAALAVAPSSKLLYSSDGVWVPELHWLAARDGRRVLGRVLGECVAWGELRLGEAEAAGVAILRDNASRLYGLGA